MKLSIMITFGAIAIGLVAAVATLLIQPPPSWDHSVDAFHFSLSSNTLALLLHIGAAVLFILSLGVYKQKMRVAFSGLVAGIVLIALGVFQLPVLDTLDAWNSAYVTGGLVGVPFLVSGLITFFGAAAFGHLVGDDSLLTNKLVAIPATLLLAVTSTFLPHVETTVEEMSFDLSNFVLSWTMVLLMLAGTIFLRSSQRIGTHYKPGMLWTGAALLVSSSCLAIAILNTLVSTATRDPITEFLNVLTVAAGFVWLKAGYTFTNTKEY